MSDKFNPFWRFPCLFLMYLYRKKHQNLCFLCFCLIKTLKGTLKTAFYGTWKKTKTSLQSWQVYFHGFSVHEVAKWEPERAQGQEHVAGSIKQERFIYRCLGEFACGPLNKAHLIFSVQEISSLLQLLNAMTRQQKPVLSISLFMPLRLI